MHSKLLKCIFAAGVIAAVISCKQRKTSESSDKNIVNKGTLYGDYKMIGSIQNGQALATVVTCDSLKNFELVEKALKDTPHNDKDIVDAVIQNGKCHFMFSMPETESAGVRFFSTTERTRIINYCTNVLQVYADGQKWQWNGEPAIYEDYYGKLFARVFDSTNHNVSSGSVNKYHADLSFCINSYLDSLR